MGGRISTSRCSQCCQKCPLVERLLNDYSCIGVTDMLGVSACRGRNDRQAIDDRFQDHCTSRIITRRVYEDVRSGHQLRDILMVSKPLDPVRHTNLASELDNFGRSVVVLLKSNNQQARVGKLAQCSHAAIYAFGVGLDRNSKPDPILRRQTKLCPPLSPGAIASKLGFAPFGYECWRQQGHSLRFRLPPTPIFIELGLTQKKDFSEPIRPKAFFLESCKFGITRQ